jgi:hypothetical protein
MKTFFTLLATLLLCSAPAQAQTIKTLGFNTTNGQVVANTGTNTLTFTNAVNFASGDLQFDASGGIYWSGDIRYEPETQTFYGALGFDQPGGTRTNLGLGATDSVQFSQVIATAFKAGTNFSALEIDSGSQNGAFKFKTTNTNDGAIYLESFTNGVAHKVAILGVRASDAFIQSSSTNVRIETSGGGLANLDANTISVTNSAATRTNLGLGGGLITNISITGTNNTNTLVFSNGILREVTTP